MIKGLIIIALGILSFPTIFNYLDTIMLRSFCKTNTLNASNKIHLPFLNSDYFKSQNDVSLQDIDKSHQAGLQM